ncbi:histidine phosphatase superfamily [Apodospora peruviana]|uniref:Histidine phosphatase superfamily n=1 Tax=Apodospora peruviana TaxID=516989 RepID=A0AAE0HYU5_9PEZI|nr:histidine phosphatase superfamily [Apodospora peruviana]
MRLLLVRHGETVDNVAGLYSGVRDSPLTAHGVLQARRLAAHLVSSSFGSPIERVFSSDLQRAANTAQAIVDTAAAASSTKFGIPDRAAPIPLVKVTELRERDFGSAEGKRFGTPRTDAETHEEMRVRAERFVQARLGPLLVRDAVSGGAKSVGTVVIVAHGIILNSLLRALLMRYAPAELARLTGPGPAGQSVYLASWSNTGYLQAVVKAGPTSGLFIGGSSRSSVTSSGTLPSGPTIGLVVERVNVLDHLEGLKKTRGGIGSAQYDNRQRTISSFFGPATKKLREAQS